MKLKKDRFSIRKFTVGAASVLIGFTFMGAVNSQEVKADTKPVSPEPSPAAQMRIKVNKSSQMLVRCKQKLKL